MANKKNEDYELRPLDPNQTNGPNSPGSVFTARVSPPRPQMAYLSTSITSISESPGISVIAYCLSSISMTVVNKYVVSGKFWNLNFFYLAVQAIVCVMAITACKHTGIMPNIAPFDIDRARKWFPVSLLLVGMIYTSTKALQFLSVPVYTIFKNLTIIVIAYGEVLWFGGSVSPLTLLSFGLMVLSSVVAAWADIQSALHGNKNDSHDAAAAISALNAGYAWMGMNVICTASYVLGTRKAIQRLSLKDMDAMYYNNLLTIPVLVICSFLVEDWSIENMKLNFPIETRNSLFVGMIYSGLAAIFISYCSAWCIRMTTSTTYSMVGALNKLPLAICGLIFFAAPVTVGSVSAIILGVISGIVYARAKVLQSERSKMTLPISKPAISASSQSSRDAAAS